MRKFFLIPLMTLCTCVMAFAGNVGTLQELKDALAVGGEITLTDNITTSEVLTIGHATTIDGQGFYIKGTAAHVMSVTASEQVVLKNMTVYAARKADNTGAILLGANNINLLIDNVRINSTCRGINQTTVGLSGMNVTIKNSILSLVWGSGLEDDGTANSINYDQETYYAYSNYSRGINVYAQNSTFTIENSTIQGFFYNVNVPGQNTQGMNFVASNCAFKGRAAMNVWGTNGTYTYNDCTVRGINNFSGSQEFFACFVFNNNGSICANNSLTINGGTVVSTWFNDNGAANPKASQFFLASRGKDNTIVVNNAQYSCPKNYGNEKGGVVEYVYGNGQNTITINDGIYDCPELIHQLNNTNQQLFINGGTYVLNQISAEIATYPVILYNDTEIKGGTFNLDMSQVYNYIYLDELEEEQTLPMSLIAEGYKQVTNANGTYSIIPETTEEKVVADGVNDVNWNTAADWATTSQEATVVPDAATSVTIGNGTDDVSVVVANDGAADVYRVDLNDKVTLTVQDGGVLTVGDGGIVAHENAEVVVEEGGSLVLNGLIQGTENIVIEASEENSAAVLIAPDVNTYGDEHPVGTFRFKSKSYKNGSKVVHQRFGMPTYNTGIDVKYGTTSSAKTYITNWDYEADDWKHSGDVVEWTEIPSSGSLPLVTVGPFACYDLISNNAKGDEITYEFTGALMGNADGEMKFNRGFNPYANSYTAPIDIESFLNRIASDYVGTDIKPTIYLYKAQANDNYTWASIGLDEFEFGDAEFTEVAPMQAFMLYLGSSTPQIASIDYEGNVYDPFMAKLSNPAPARRVATKKNYLSMTITDAEGVEYDRVKFIEDDRFSSAFDNGYDAVKFMKEDVAIYAAADEAQATVASDYVEGMNIGVKVAKSGVYTLTVKYNGLDYALIDTENNTIIELENGKTYNFFAEAGQNDARFQVIKVNKVSTAIDEVEDSQVMSTKFMKDGVLYIIKNGAVYNAQGQIVK